MKILAARSALTRVLPIFFGLLSLVSCEGSHSNNSASLQAAPAPTPAPPEYQIPASIGAVLWAGQYSGARPGFALGDGATRLAAKGFQNITFPLDPANFGPTFGITDVAYTSADFLTEAVSSAPVQEALSNPRIVNYVFAAYDAIVEGTDGSKRLFKSQQFLEANEAAIENDYEQMALVLFRTYKGTGKRFIVSTWESDNSMYCDSVYDYVLSSAAAAACDAAYASGSYGADTTTIQQAYVAYSVWLTYRQNGIQRARAQALKEGDTDVSVLSGAEFDAYQMLGPAAPTLLHSVLKTIRPDVLGYSAYESTNVGTLLTDLPGIAAITQGSELDVTEFGFADGVSLNVGGTAYTAEEMLKNTSLDIQRLAAQGLIHFGLIWQGFMDTASPTFGLLNPDGSNGALFEGLLRSF